MTYMCVLKLLRTFSVLVVSWPICHAEVTSVSIKLYKVCMTSIRYDLCGFRSNQRWLQFPWKHMYTQQQLIGMKSWSKVYGHQRKSLHNIFSGSRKMSRLWRFIKAISIVWMSSSVPLYSYQIVIGGSRLIGTEELKWWHYSERVMNSKASVWHRASGGCRVFMLNFSGNCWYRFLVRPILLANRLAAEKSLD